MDLEEDAGVKEGPMKSGDLSKEHERVSNGNTRLSYANVVGKSLKTGGFSLDGMELDLHKVVVLDEDCVVNREGQFPTIKFSERVHDQIDSTMRNVIIVHLLGRNIGYQSLLNRIHALWKPSREVQLVDLENNYFLVRVEDPRDYERILTEGPWTIYGIYLTMQPWSRTFSTSEKHPSRVVVWVRLPGLPYRYYSKALFRRIAAIVGEVVRVDYNTQAGERGKFARLAVTVDLNKPLVPCIGIDDFTQQLEYEGLQNICFKCGVYGHSQELCTHGTMKVNADSGQRQCSDNVDGEISKEVSKEGLFGPWMVVDTRRRRAQAARVVHREIEQDKGPILGSRFVVLKSERMDPVVEQVSGMVDNLQQVAPIVQGTSTVAELNLIKPVDTAVGKEGQVKEVGNGSGKKVDAGKGMMSKAIVLLMVEGQQVSLVEHAGHSKVHAAVSIFEQGHGKVGTGKNGSERTLGGKAKGVKENAKQGLKIRKPSEMRTISRPVLSEWIDNMNSQLDSFAMDKELDPGGDTRGAASPMFQKYFNVFRREYAPKVVGLFEPRISGRQANRVVVKLGFSHSFRVEAQGFSGGIWLLWDLDVDLEILHLSNQFVNGRVRWRSRMSWLHFTIVYASPSSTRRRALWTQNETLNPGATIPWFVEGDFNVILLADERRGGSDSHTQGSRPFADFIFRTGFSNMGFRGLPFTWSRGNLYQRLDQCLANNAWISKTTQPFSDLLKRTWGGDDFLANANSFINEVKDWNLSVFGNIGKKKKRLLARLKGIDAALARSHSDSLVDFGHKLRSELEDIMNQEESLWSQKACANWILQGDRNTGFFHDSTMARRRVNFISGLKLHGTDWF
ncbi:hypothetical protein GQ457_03G022350 [Hibiscus cannabinus]